MTSRTAAKRTTATRASARRSAAPSTRKSFPLTTTRPELLKDGSDRDFRRLVHGLFSFLSCHERLRAGHARYIGLAGIEYTTMISIAHLSLERDVNIKTVADHLRLSGAFITSVTRKLVAKGLVEKVVDPTDRRRVNLTVSTKGRALLERLSPVQCQLNDLEFSPLSRAEFADLLRIIERLIASGERAVALQTYLLSSGSAEGPSES